MAIANLLGVAGTDVPIRDIKKLMMPFTVNILALIINAYIIYYTICIMYASVYVFFFWFIQSKQLGVNGYAFIVNNNGYVLTHPDFRPIVSANANISWSVK